MIPQHLSKTQEHYTPAHVVEAARACLGGIDLDPASCAEANLAVKAAEYFTKAEDGLSREWHGRVFLNPPGGRIGRRSSMAVWWERLVDEYASERVTQAIFVGFTLEILRLSQACIIPVQAFPRCYPRERLEFGGEDPTHANVIVWLPPATGTFKPFPRAFRDIGFCEMGAKDLSGGRAP